MARSGVYEDCEHTPITRRYGPSDLTETQWYRWLISVDTGNRQAVDQSMNHYKSDHTSLIIGRCPFKLLEDE